MEIEKQTESQFLEAEEILDEENSDESKVLKCTKCDEGFSTLVDLGGFQLEFVSISRVINHMTCYKFEWKIDGKFVLQ